MGNIESEDGINLIKSVHLKFRSIDTEIAVWRCSVKKGFIEHSQNSQENIWVSFLIKLQVLGWDSAIGIFL